MRCPLCQAMHVVELTFANLYDPRNICRECQALASLLPRRELIPIQGGMIEHIYLHEAVNLDHKTKNIIAFFLEKALKMAISHDLIIIIEDLEYQTFPIWFALFEGFGAVAIISIVWMDIAAKYNAIAERKQAGRFTAGGHDVIINL